MSNNLPVPELTPSADASASNRETRAHEALKMKDNQIKLLADQNTALLKSLDNVEEECNLLQSEKLTIKEDMRKLKDENFELQSKNRAVETALRKIEQEIGDRDQKVKIMSSQNSELLRLLETEESQTATLARERSELRDALEALKGKYSSLLTTAKTHEELAGRAAREGQLRAEELRLLRSECEQLRVQNAEMERKSAVDIESLQEQLRVRKEKQYHLLEKMQAAEESKRQAEDQTAAMTEKMRALHARTVELETQLQVETKAKRDQEVANRMLSVEEENLRRSNAELQEKTRQSDEERLRMETETRDSGNQLREMAEKVFQLLERLKLAELGKNKSIEQLRKCEQDLVAVKKKSSRLLQESTNEGKQRVKAELDKKVLLDQIRSLKTHNAELANRCRAEVKTKLKEHEERKAAEEKVRTLGGRLSFLLNKLQADEEVKIQMREEMKKMEAQIKTLAERSDELLIKLNATGESNRIVTQAMRLKQEEVEALQLKYAALLKKMRQNKSLGNGNNQEDDDSNDSFSSGGDGNGGGGGGGGSGGGHGSDGDGGGGSGPSSSSESNEIGEEPDAKTVKQSGGKGRFYLDAKPSQGFIMIKTKRATANKLLERLDINGYLKRAQKHPKFKELVIEKITHVLGLLLVEETEHIHTNRNLEARMEQIDYFTRKVTAMQQQIGDEEDAKRRTLLRYVQVVKAHTENGSLQLAESGVGDEEIHALSALVRGSNSIRELNICNNSVTDSGARALAAVLAGPPATNLRSIDIRKNQLTEAGIHILAEALERAQNTRHVYVHAGGKIEALGTVTKTNGHSAGVSSSDLDYAANVTVETVCVVDAREQVDKTKAPVTIGKAAIKPNAWTRETNEEGTKAAATSKRSPTAREAEQKTTTPKRRAAKDTKTDKRKAQEERRLRQAEAGWKGRSGGFDIQLPPLPNGEDAENKS